MSVAFEVTGTKLMVTDPCYTRGTWSWCQGVVENVLPGKWRARADFQDNGQTGGWGDRVAVLEAHHEGFLRSYIDRRWERCSFEVGVDSGQAGIFDESRYPQGETGDYGSKGSFYNDCCETTLGEHMFGSVQGMGVVSRSGYGDGGYVAHVARDDEGHVVAVKVTFIGGEDDDDAA